MTPIIRHFGTTLLAKIDQVAIEDCARSLMPKAKPSTLTRQIYTPVSAVLSHAAARGMCEAKKVERPKQPNGKTRWMTVQEATRLVAACPDHLAPLVKLMLYTGARVSEALYLDWNEVDLQRRFVIYKDTKNGETRGVPLHPIALAALANLSHREGAVFRRPEGRWAGEPYSPRGDNGTPIKKAFNSAVRRAGLKDVTPHTCRHTWATWHYMEHRDLLALMTLGGWKQISMVQRYAHVNVENLAPSIAAMPSLGEIWGNTENKKRKA